VCVSSRCCAASFFVSCVAAFLPSGSEAWAAGSLSTAPYANGGARRAWSTAPSPLRNSGKMGNAISASGTIGKGQRSARSGSPLDGGQIAAPNWSRRRHREWSGVRWTVRAGMLAVPSRVAARRPHLSKHAIAEIVIEIRTALDEIGNARGIANARHRPPKRDALSDPTAAPAIVAVDRKQHPPAGGHFGAAGCACGPSKREIADAIGDPSPSLERKEQIFVAARDQVGQFPIQAVAIKGLGRRMVGPAGLEPATRRL
jgi:hypothetical protein